jgi:chromosome partitioning protein
MDVTVVANQKGGVGKSATTLNVGAALAEAGHRVLLIDLDPQGHLTRALGLSDADPEANLPRALLGQWDGELGDLVVKSSDRLYVVPASQDMFVLEPQLYSRTGREWLLSRLLDAFAPGFDHCLIDCPPSLGALTDAALVAARTDGEHTGQVLIPVQAEDSSLDALRLLLRQIATISQVLGIQVPVAGLVVNLYDARRGRVATSMLEVFQKRNDVLAVIGDRKEIREGWRLKEPVVVHAPDSEPAGWFRDLAKQLAVAR